MWGARVLTSSVDSHDNIVSTENVCRDKCSAQPKPYWESFYLHAKQGTATSQGRGRDRSTSARIGGVTTRVQSRAGGLCQEVCSVSMIHHPSPRLLRLGGHPHLRASKYTVLSQ